MNVVNKSNSFNLCSRLAGSLCTYKCSPGLTVYATRAYGTDKREKQNKDNININNNNNNNNNTTNNNNNNGNNNKRDKRDKTKTYDEEIAKTPPPSPFNSKDLFGLKRIIAAVEFDTKGNTTDRSFSNHQITNEMNIQMRDLRNIDHAYPPQKASILVRERAVIVHIEPVRAVIQWNRMLLFTAGHDHVYTTLSPSLKEYLFLQASPATHMAVGLALPFEFRALEALLIYVCETFERRVSELSPSIEAEIKNLQSNPEHQLNNVTMYQHKKNLAHCETDIHEIKSALAELLQNDEDMAAMYLSTKAATGYPRRKNQHEEIETLLENYLRQIEQIEGAIKELRETITVTEEYVNLQLDSSRNRMMRHTLVLSVGTMSTSVGGLIFSAFGMNLTTGLETHPFAFWVTMGLVPAGILGFYFALKSALGLQHNTSIPLLPRKRMPFLPPPEMVYTQHLQQLHHLQNMHLQKTKEAEEAQALQDFDQDVERLNLQQQQNSRPSCSPHHQSSSQQPSAQQLQQQSQQLQQQSQQIHQQIQHHQQQLQQQVQQFQQQHQMKQESKSKRTTEQPFQQELKQLQQELEEHIQMKEQLKRGEVPKIFEGQAEAETTKELLESLREVDEMNQKRRH